MVKSAKKSLHKKGTTKTLKDLPFNRFIPNLITLTTLCAGLSAIRFGLQSMWGHAVLAIVIAAILDGTDGRVARFLGTTSRFGAELDSLADFCNFGVAPGILLYLYRLQTLDNIGWIFCLFFTMCMALRLARFNAFLDETPPPLFASGQFFMGIPAPAGGILVCLPIIIDLAFPGSQTPLIFHTLIVLITALLLVSRIPTFSFKKTGIPRAYVLPLFILAGILIASFVQSPWIILLLIAVLYLGLIPLSIKNYRRKSKALEP